MHSNSNNYLFKTPHELQKRAFIGKSAINIILFVSLISTMGYWYVLGLQASNATGFWALLAFSIIGIGLVTEFVKKITLSLFRHRGIWLGATMVSVATIMGTLSIIDNNKESGLIKSSSEYRMAQARQENAFNAASKWAWAGGFNLDQLNNDLINITAKRERREIGYQAYLAEKRAIHEKINAKRNYDSSLNMQTMAGAIMANGSSLTTSSNPMLYNIATATGVTAAVLKTIFYLAVTLLLEFAAWFLGGEVEKINNQLTMTKAQLLDAQNMDMFGVSVASVNQFAYADTLRFEAEQQAANAELEQIRHNQLLATAERMKKNQAIQAELDAYQSQTTPVENKKHKLGFVDTDQKSMLFLRHKNPIRVDKSTREQQMDKSVDTDQNDTVGNTTDSVTTERMLQLYLKSQKTKSGEGVQCPVCERSFIKTGFKIFCSNKGKGNCADEYKNILNPERLIALENKRRKQRASA